MYTEDIILSTKFKHDGPSSTSLDKLQIEMKKYKDQGPFCWIGILYTQKKDNRRCLFI